MQVLIDDGFSISRGTGIGRYTVDIARALAEHAPGVAVRQADLGPFFRVRPRQLRRVAYMGWLATGYARQLRRDPPDVVHFTNYLPAFRKPRGVCYASTIHDLAAFTYAQTKSAVYMGYLRQTIAHAVRISDVIFADSHAVKAELVTELGVPESRIQVCYIGTHMTPLDRPEAAAVLAKLAPTLVDQPFLLFVGSLERRKNLVPLVRAFRLLASRFPALRLVLAGRPGIGFDSIEAAITAVDPNRERVHVITSVDDRGLRALYSTCTVFVFPSLYEGYGIPLLEAMVCGAPVVGSDIPTNAELLGDAGLVVAAQPETLGEAIASLLESETRRQELIERGRARVQQFSPRTTAAQLLAGYRLAGARVPELEATSV